MIYKEAEFVEVNGTRKRRNKNNGLRKLTAHDHHSTLRLVYYYDEAYVSLRDVLINVMKSSPRHNPDSDLKSTDENERIRYAEFILSPERRHSIRAVDDRTGHQRLFSNPWIITTAAEKRLQCSPQSVCLHLAAAKLQMQGSHSAHGSRRNGSWITDVASTPAGASDGEGIEDSDQDETMKENRGIDRWSGHVGTSYVNRVNSVLSCLQSVHMLLVRVASSHACGKPRPESSDDRHGSWRKAPVCDIRTPYLVIASTMINDVDAGGSKGMEAGTNDMRNMGYCKKRKHGEHEPETTPLKNRPKCKRKGQEKVETAR
jgi:hypothetical protein